MTVLTTMNHPLLSESETRFRTMADNAPVLLWMAGPDEECDFFNQGWLQFTGRSMDQELGTGWAEGVHAEDLPHCMHTYFEALVARRPFSMEYRLRRRDGVYRWIYDQGAPRFEADGTFAGYIGSCVDITEQRQARDALRALAAELKDRVEERTRVAREREVLLREVHHRVKNDLQLISSILKMQQRQLTDPKGVAALEESNGRVETIALIHEHMYRSSNLKHLSFSENVRSMTAGLFRAADLQPGKLRLEVDVEDDIRLPVDRAIPCGLVLNELLRNSLKHAFPDGRDGTIRVCLKRRIDGRVALTVADDGVGFDSDRLLGDGLSLGRILIEALAEQMRADMHMDRSSGSSVSLVFALDNNGAKG